MKKIPDHEKNCLSAGCHHALPADQDYSPLWLKYIYDNADFDKVSNHAEAEAATLVTATSVNVNCPVVYLGE